MLQAHGSGIAAAAGGCWIDDGGGLAGVELPLLPVLVHCVAAVVGEGVAGVVGAAIALVLRGGCDRGGRVAADGWRSGVWLEITWW